MHSPPFRSWRQRYGLAVILPLVSLLLRHFVDPVVGDSALLITFAPAVMVSAWYGGLGPGLLATVLGATAGHYYLVDPPKAFDAPSIKETVSLCIFLTAGGIISVLNEALHRQQCRIREAGWELVRTEARFHRLLDGIRDYAIASLDKTGAVVHWMPGAQRITGYSAEEVLGRSYLQFFRWDDAIRLGLETALAMARDTGRFEWETWHRKRDGEPFWANSVITPLEQANGELTGYALITRDITERRRAEERLRASESKLRELSVYLQSVREEERTRIAREIHDELGQSLSFLKMGLAWLKSEVPERATETVTQLNQTLESSVRSIRRIAADLRPSVLDELGIAAAIEWQAEAFTGQTGIQCSLSADRSRLELDKEAETALFRILQESLTNILRHAQAKRVDVLLASDDVSVTLEIHDDGCGISEETLSGSAGLGILGMRERALSVGGSLEIGLHPEGGTRVRVTLPVYAGSQKELAAGPLEARSCG